MTRFAALPLLAVLAAAPLAAQETPAEEGWSLMQQGATLLFDGLRSEMEPALQDMAAAFAGAEPMLRDLIGMMGDVTRYQAPEILPNGDIIIRRKPAEEMAVQPPAPEVEL